MPLSRVVALHESQHDEYANSWAGGVWAPNCNGYCYRVINHTAFCHGPRLLIFEGESAPPGNWLPVPEAWQHDGYVSVFVSKGTLVPLPAKPDGDGTASERAPKRRKPPVTSGAKAGGMPNGCSPVTGGAPVHMRDGLPGKLQMPISMVPSLGMPGGPAPPGFPGLQFAGVPGGAHPVGLSGQHVFGTMPLPMSMPTLGDAAQSPGALTSMPMPMVDPATQQLFMPPGHMPPPPGMLPVVLQQPMSGVNGFALQRQMSAGGAEATEGAPAALFCYHQSP